MPRPLYNILCNSFSQLSKSRTLSSVWLEASKMSKPRANQQRRQPLQRILFTMRRLTKCNRRRVVECMLPQCFVHDMQQYDTRSITRPARQTTHVGHNKQRILQQIRLPRNPSKQRTVQQIRLHGTADNHTSDTTSNELPTNPSTVRRHRPTKPPDVREFSASQCVEDSRQNSTAISQHAVSK